MSSRQTRIIRGSIVAICRICRENASRDILETDSPGIDGKCSENVFPQLRNTVHGSNLYFVDRDGNRPDSSIALLELCPWLDLAICQSPPYTASNEQVHQACRAHPVSGRSNQSRSWPWRNPWPDSHLSRPDGYNEHMQRVTSSSRRVRVQLVFHQYQNTQESATNYDPVCGWMRLNTRNGNRQLLFLHGRIQSLLTRRPDAHTIIKPHGVSSEDPLKDSYPLQLSE